MKKLAIAILLLGSTTVAHAEYNLVSADGSSLSSLCLAAVASPTQLTAIARAHGIAAHEIDTVRCNDLPLKRFVLKYGATPSIEPQVAVNEVAGTEIAGYLLRKNDESPLTELCAAAALSDQEYAKVKAQHFEGESRIDSEVLCNGQPLKSFVRKFRNADVRLVGFR